MNCTCFKRADSKGATDVIAMLKERFERLVKIVADGGYRGEIIDKTKTAFAWIPEIVYGQTIQTNLSRYPKDGLLKERLLGLKAIEGLVKTWISY